MIETAILIWLYLAVWNVLGFMTLFSLLAIALASPYLLGVLTGSMVLPEHLKPITKKSGIAIVIIWALTAIYPSKNDLKYIVGGTALVQAAKIDGVEKLPNNLVAAMNTTLEALKEKEND